MVNIMKVLEDKELIGLIEKLPPNLREEVKDFVRFLLQKEKKKKKLKLNWVGKLSKYKKDYTSLELQKKAMEWREDI